MLNLRLKKNRIREKLIFPLVIFTLIFSSNLKAQNPFDIISNVLDNATFVSSNLPTSLKAGQTYSASITYRNTGLHTWGTNEPYKLALHDVNDNSYQTDVWGVRTASLPNDVKRDDRVTFNFDIRAPYQSGVYNLRWSMMKDNSFFGESTPSLLVNISGDENVQLYSNIRTGGAQFINQSVPSTMVAGQKYRVLITIKNTGSSTWYPSSYGSNNGDYKLASVNGNSYTNWGVSPVYLTRPVAPGITETFEVEVVAPSTQGTYDFQWQMMQGNTYFGERTANVPVYVTSSYYNQPPPPNNYYYISANSASFVSQSVPYNMRTSRSYTVSVTMTNTGNSAWTRGGYYLSYYTDPRLMRVTVVNPWGIDNIGLPYDVSPGQSAVFTFNVTASSTPGTYDFQWIMNNGGSTFGDPSSLVQASVVRRSINY
jgi:hypothetical protein